ADAIAQIQQHLAAHDADALARVSHMIKGTAGLVSAEALRSAAARMEEIGRNHTLDLAEECLGELTRELGRCAAHAARVKTELSAVPALRPVCLPGEAQ